jgi:hypothetical protein
VKNPSANNKLMALAVTLGNGDTYVQEKFNEWSNVEHENEAARFLGLLEVVTRRMLGANCSFAHEINKCRDFEFGACSRDAACKFVH